MSANEGSRIILFFLFAEYADSFRLLKVCRVCVCLCVWYLFWSCWMEIVRNAEQSVLASSPGQLRLSFGTCVCLRAVLIGLLCEWDIVPNNGIRRKWSVWWVCLPYVRFYSWPFSAPFPRLSVFLFSHGLCEPGARRDDHALWPVLRIPADRPLPRGPEDHRGNIVSLLEGFICFC